MPFANRYRFRIARNSQKIKHAAKACRESGDPDDLLTLLHAWMSKLRFASNEHRLAAEHEFLRASYSEKVSSFLRCLNFREIHDITYDQPLDWIDLADKYLETGDLRCVDRNEALAHRVRKRRIVDEVLTWCIKDSFVISPTSSAAKKPLGDLLECLMRLDDFEYLGFELDQIVKRAMPHSGLEDALVERLKWEKDLYSLSLIAANISWDACPEWLRPIKAIEERNWSRLASLGDAALPHMIIFLHWWSPADDARIGMLRIADSRSMSPDRMIRALIYLAQNDNFSGKWIDEIFAWLLPLGLASFGRDELERLRTLELSTQGTYQEGFGAELDKVEFIPVDTASIRKVVEAEFGNR